MSRHGVGRVFSVFYEAENTQLIDTQRIRQMNFGHQRGRQATHRVIFYAPKSNALWRKFGQIWAMLCYALALRCVSSRVLSRVPCGPVMTSGVRRRRPARRWTPRPPCLGVPRPHPLVGGDAATSLVTTRGGPKQLPTGQTLIPQIFEIYRNAL